jgi:predicted alpha-1,2-mannosidase
MFDTEKTMVRGKSISVIPTLVSASRRDFLKSSSLVAASIATFSPASAEAAQPIPTTEPDSSSEALVTPIDFVNVLQGTQSTPAFSHGNTLPIAATPFGMAHWTIQNASGPWMFQPWNRRIQGFRCTHQLSPWLHDYGSATFLPVAGGGNADAASRASSYIPEQAKLTPDSFEIFLLRYRVRVQLAPTERCCILAAQYDNPLDGDERHAPALIIEIPSLQGDVAELPSTHRIQFASNQTSGGTPKNFATYYVIEFTEPWESCEVQHHKDHEGIDRQILTVFFKGNRLEARIATSFISFDQAAYNLEQEIGRNSIETIRQRARAQWNEMLGRITVDGASSQQKRTLYSCLYRTMLFPRTFHEPVPHGNGMHHYSAFNGKVEPGVMYADHGYWDVYRAWYPLASILFPEKLGEILQAWVNALREGGWFPQFPAPGYRACMSGSLIDSLFADAIVKNIGTFNPELVFEGLKKHATQPGDPDKGYGRVGVEDYIRLHYVPADKIEQSVAETADAAYGDFCIAQIAKALDKHDEYDAFLQRSTYWTNVYDKQIGFFRGKNADGSWLSPFDSFTWGSPYEEGSAWQHRWNAPHAVPQLIEAIGGRMAAAEALEKMLSVPPIFNVGVYGSEIHEMSEMAAVPFGQYAHSNQPSHHLLYLFAHAGRSDRLQFWARRVMEELYTPDSFAGDEDTGSMAAWYVLSALGIYQVCPGVPEYTFGSPLFQRATVHLAKNKTLVVEAPKNSPVNVYVQSVRFNGALRSGITIGHSELTAGGTLRFDMASKARV